jgi:uncharacterized protein
VKIETCIPASFAAEGETDLSGAVRAMAKGLFDGARASHDWEHTQRVVLLCRRIGSAEGADMRIVETAAYLHDIGRSRQDRSCGAVCHAETGARMAADLLEQVPLDPQQRRQVVACIRSHRFRGGDLPESLEARVLFDADKLDAIGAVGVARAFLFAGEVGARLHSPLKEIDRAAAYSEHDTGYREYRVKLCKIKDRLLTAEGRRIAVDRHAFMETFFQRFLVELDGRE